MSKEDMKHTPGPWYIDPIKAHANGNRRIMAEQCTPVAVVPEHLAANARLIAAAPDLLEALDDLARYADTCELFLRETHPGKADMLRKRVTAAIDAMAKATGGEV